MARTEAPAFRSSYTMDCFGSGGQAQAHSFGKTEKLVESPSSAAKHTDFFSWNMRVGGWLNGKCKEKDVSLGGFYAVIFDLAWHALTQSRHRLQGQCGSWRKSAHSSIVMAARTI